MEKALVVIDMQNDFIDGALGSPEAQAILPAVQKKVAAFDGRILFTRDTHDSRYLETAEGKKLPVPHCIQGSRGWHIHDSLRQYATVIVDKPAFGSLALAAALMPGVPEQITLIGLCTDICVISNAMILKAAFPETEIIVDSTCCAGVTPESHALALKAMEGCQVLVV